MPLGDDQIHNIANKWNCDEPNEGFHKPSDHDNVKPKIVEVGKGACREVVGGLLRVVGLVVGVGISGLGGRALRVLLRLLVDRRGAGGLAKGGAVSRRSFSVCESVRKEFLGKGSRPVNQVCSRIDNQSCEPGMQKGSRMGNGTLCSGLHCSPKAVDGGQDLRGIVRRGFDKGLSGFDGGMSDIGSRVPDNLISRIACFVHKLCDRREAKVDKSERVNVRGECKGEASRRISTVGHSSSDIVQRGRLRLHIKPVFEGRHRRVL